MSRLVSNDVYGDGNCRRHLRKYSTCRAGVKLAADIRVGGAVFQALAALALTHSHNYRTLYIAVSKTPVYI